MAKPLNVAWHKNFVPTVGRFRALEAYASEPVVQMQWHAKDCGAVCAAAYQSLC
jgi:hypothetical protein